MPNTPAAFIVHEYTPQILLNLLSEHSSPDRIARKVHYEYLQEYLNKFHILNDQESKKRDISLLVENEYIDHDYMEDFQAYYVRCKEPYKRECKRLHFFALKFSTEDFSNFLINKNGLDIEEIRSSYLGFIVVKPLPYTVIGRTCLQTYRHQLLKNDTYYNERFFPATRKYAVSLFGLELEVESIAFQEQDRVVSACATSALWSAFQTTGNIFQHSIPSPIEITQAATKSIVTNNRVLPNDGLTPEQMIYAIHNIGLDVIAENVGPKFTFLSKIYAYLNAGIPVILLIELITDLKKPLLSGPRKGTSIGQHAVTISGYRIVDPQGYKIGSASFFSKANGITKIFVHDDQIGPFARMGVDDEFITIEGDNKKYYSLSTSWEDSSFEKANTRAIPISILIPIYKKIRIPLSSVQDAIVLFESFLLELYDAGHINVSSYIWDIQLSNVEKLKNGYFSLNGNISDLVKRKVLYSSLPKYIWKASAEIIMSSGEDSTKKILFDLLFDATGIAQGNYFLEFIPREMNFYHQLISALKLPKYDPSIYSGNHTVKNILISIGKSDF